MFFVFSSFAKLFVCPSQHTAWDSGPDDQFHAVLGNAAQVTAHCEEGPAALAFQPWT